MPYTLSQAAEAVGMNRSSILRAIKAGKISATPGQATFLAQCFFALLGGALFNAWLNRRRDNWLRREEQRAVATALRAELAGC
jgi:hypothetical protein